MKRRHFLLSALLALPGLGWVKAKKPITDEVMGHVCDSGCPTFIEMTRWPISDCGENRRARFMARLRKKGRIIFKRSGAIPYDWQKWRIR